MATINRSNLRIVERAANGKVREYSLEKGTKIPAQPNSTYTLIDSTTQKPPAEMVLKRHGQSLVLDVADNQNVGEVTNFFEERGAAFNTDGALAANSGAAPVGTSGSLVTASTPQVGTMGGDPVVWAAKDHAMGAALPAAAAPTFSPLTALMAGLAGVAAAAGGGGGSAAVHVASAIITDGVVIDGPLKNALVFRDSDGDGKWYDANGNGIWDQGDEEIVVTDSNGQFTGLGGTGQIVSVGIDHLVSKTSSVASVSHLATDTIVTKDGTHVTGVAIDTTSGLPFSGIFVAPGVAVAQNASGGDSYYVTGVSTLVAALLQAQNITNPTAADIIQAAQTVNTLLNSDFVGSVNSGTSAVNFFQSSANEQLTVILTQVYAQAESQNSDPVAAVNAALLNLANEINNPTLGHSIDLTSSQDLQDVLGVSSTLADAMALAATTGFSGQDIWFEPTGDVTSKLVSSSDHPIGNITVIGGHSVSADVSLQVGGDHHHSNYADHLSDEPVELSGSSVTVVADTNNAELILTGHVSETAEALGGITIKAISDVVQACADIALDGHISGNILVQSAGEDSNAGLYLHGIETVTVTGPCSEIVEYSDVVMDGGSITVRNGGAGDQAFLYAQNLSGTVGDITVETTVDSYAGSATALLDFGYNASNDLALDGSISVQAQGDDTAAVLRVYALDGGTIDSLTVNAAGSGTSADAWIVAPGATVNGSVDVAASGFSAEAGLLVAGLDFSDNDITVDASGTNSSAYFAAYGATGTIGNLTVTAADYSRAYARVNSGDVTIENLSIDAAGSDSFAGARLIGNYSADSSGLFNDSAVSVTASGENATAYLTAYYASGSIGSLTVNASGDASGYCGDYAAAYVGFVSSDVTIDTLEVTASGARAEARVGFFSSDVALGNVTIEASGYYSQAAVLVGRSYDGSSLTFNDGDISVAASGVEASAYFTAYHASGSIDSLTVNAGGTDGCADYAYARAAINSSDVTISSLTVTANAYEASASAEFNSSEVTIGDVSIEASGYGSDAEVILGRYYDDSSVTFNGASAISVTASGEDASAYLAAYHASGNIGSLTITANGTNSYASAEFFSSTVSIDALTVTTSGAGSYASADFISSDVTLGDVTIEASGYYSNAEVILGRSYDGSSVTFNDASAISVTASGDLASAYLAAYHASGNIGSLTITANGTNSYASAEFNSSTVTIDSLSINASGNYSEASADFYASDVTLGDVTLEASGYDSYAELTLGRCGDDSSVTFNDSTISVTASGGDATASFMAYHASGSISSLTVNTTETGASGDYGYAYAGFSSSDLTINTVDITASRSESRASADFHRSDVTIGSLTIKADGYDTNASVEFDSSTVTIESLTITASGENSEASADFYASDVTLGDVSIEASGYDARVEVTLGRTYDDSSVTFDHSTISVTASGSDAAAYFDAYQATGSIGSLTVIAGGSEGCGDYQYAYAGFHAGTVTLDTLTVTASGTSSDAWVNFDSSVVTLDGVSIQASGRSSDAEVTLGSNSDGSSVTFNDSIISVTASSHDASASFTAYHASGTIGSLTVNAGKDEFGVYGEYSNAHAWIYDASDITIGELNVTAASYDANASAGIQSSSVTLGDVSVEASGYDSEADVNLGSNCDDSSVTFDHSIISVVSSAEDASASFTAYHASGTIDELTVDASNHSSSSLTIDGMDGDVTQLSLYAYSADVGATLSFSGEHHVVRTDIEVGSDYALDSASVSLTVDGDFGGEVHAQSQNWDNADSEFNLTYLDGSAEKIYLGDTTNGQYFNFADEDGNLLTGSNEIPHQSQLNLTLSDANHDYSAADALANMLQIWGSDMGTAGGDDTLKFAHNGSFDMGGFDDAGSFDTVDDFLASLSGTLGEGTQYAFGTDGTDGWLAYDQDGSGISTLIEFHNMTTIDWSRLVNASAPG